MKALNVFEAVKDHYHLPKQNSAPYSIYSFGSSQQLQTTNVTKELSIKDNFMTMFLVSDGGAALLDVLPEGSGLVLLHLVPLLVQHGHHNLFIMYGFLSITLLSTIMAESSSSSSSSSSGSAFAGFHIGGQGLTIG